MPFYFYKYAKSVRILSYFSSDLYGNNDRKQITQPQRFRQIKRKYRFVFFYVQDRAEQCIQNRDPEHYSRAGNAFESEKDVTPEHVENT